MSQQYSPPPQQPWVPQPQHAAPPAPTPRNGVGLAALIIGIVALALCWIPIVGYVSIVLGVIGIVLAVVGLVNVRRKRATNPVVAIIGGVISVAAIVLALVAVVALADALDDALNDTGTLGSTTTTTEPEPTQEPAAVEPEPEPTPEPPPSEYVPVAKDFKLEVKVLSKECFGSAGCHVTFRVLVTYLSTETPDPEQTFEVIYDVKGGEETYTNTLSVTGEESSVDSEEFISTEDEDDKLTAVVTDVL